MACPPQSREFSHQGVQISRPSTPSKQPHSQLRLCRGVEFVHLAMGLRPDALRVVGRLQVAQGEKKKKHDMQVRSGHLQHYILFPAPSHSPQVIAVGSSSFLCMHPFLFPPHTHPAAQVQGLLEPLPGAARAAAGVVPGASHRIAHVGEPRAVGRGGGLVPGGASGGHEGVPRHLG